MTPWEVDIYAKLSFRVWVCVCVLLRVCACVRRVWGARRARTLFSALPLLLPLPEERQWRDANLSEAQAGGGKQYM